jgi:ribosomal protein S13
LVVDRPVNLIGAIGGLTSGENLPKLAKFHSYKGLRHIHHLNMPTRH